MSEYDYDAQYSALLVRFEDFFQSIKNLSNISAELLSVIKSNPTNASAEALATSALNQVQASPQHVDSLVVAIKNLLDTIDESIEIADEYGSSKMYITVSRASLHETQLHTPKQTVIAASNHTLSAALFSATAIKNRLFENVRLCQTRFTVARCD